MTGFATTGALEGVGDHTPDLAHQGMLTDIRTGKIGRIPLHVIKHITMGRAFEKGHYITRSSLLLSLLTGLDLPLDLSALSIFLEIISQSILLRTGFNRLQFLFYREIAFYLFRLLADPEQRH